MGTWGVGLYQDDLAEDIKTTYIDSLRNGNSPNAAYNTVLAELGAAMDDPNDASVFWFSLSDTMWSCGTLTDDVKEKALYYLDEGYDLQRWEEENPQQVQSRKRILTELRYRLNSPQPAAKKHRKPRLYSCPWNIGDVYLYPLDSAEAEALGFSGFCLLFHKTGISTFHPGHIVPVVRTKIVRQGNLPMSAKEFDSIPYLKVGTRNQYSLKLLNTSRRATPKKLMYLGNFDRIPIIEEEYVPQNDCEYISYLWKWFDGFLLKNLIRFNPRLFDF